MACPLQAKFKYVDLYPDVTNAWAEYGSALHKGAEAYNKGQSLAGATNVFIAAWEAAYTRIYFWPEGFTFADRMQMGKDALAAYDEKMRNTIRDVVAVEHEFVVPCGEFELHGFVDVVELRKDKNSQVRLCLIDHKGLPLDTKLPTPTGWTTIGAVEVGDEILAGDGLPTRVTAKSSVHQRSCYRINFRDGTSIVADDEHQWTVRHSADGWTKVLRSDELKAAGFRGGRNYLVVDNVPPVDLPERDLPIDPYVLGCWLGDGNKHFGVITKPNDALFEEIGRRGYDWNPQPANPMRKTVLGLTPRLRELGVLMDKHVPIDYLRSSVEQRLDLLRGLMDTDGSWSKQNRRAVFTQKPGPIADALFELVASLGEVPNCHTAQTANGPMVQIQWAPLNFNPFLIEPKAGRAEVRNTGQNGRRIITSVEETIAVPTQCLSVESETCEYLVGPEYLRTHNTGAVPTNAQLAYDTQFSIYDFASHAPEFWKGIDQGEEIALKFAGKQRRLIWSVLKPQMSEKIAMPRTNNDYLRLHRTMQQIQKTQDAGAHIPNISAESCGRCAYHEPCGVTIPTDVELGALA